jgi:hypothetical protein
VFSEVLIVGVRVELSIHMCINIYVYIIFFKKISRSSFINLPIVCARASWVLNLSASNPAGGCISKTKLNAHHDLGRTAVVFLKMATVGKLNWRWTLRMYMLLSPWSPAESNAAYDVLYSCVYALAIYAIVCARAVSTRLVGCWMPCRPVSGSSYTSGQPATPFVPVAYWTASLLAACLLRDRERPFINKENWLKNLIFLFFRSTIKKYDVDKKIKIMPQGVDPIAGSCPNR